MHLSTRNGAIIASLVIAGAMIALSFWFSNVSTPLASADSTEELLREYAAKDTDADGLPDWQESLYQTDPEDPHSFDATLTDGEAAEQGLIKPRFSTPEPEPIDTITDADFSEPAPKAGSLTERFAQAFMEAYLAAGQGGNLNADAQQEIIEGLIQSFSKEITATLASSFTRVIVHVNAGVTVDTYVGELENVLTHYIPEEDNDLLVLAQGVIEDRDTRAQTRIATLSTTYGDLVAALANMQVPPVLVDSHLLLMRSFDEVANASRMIAAYEEDPIATLGALPMFEPARNNILASFGTTADVVLTTIGEPAPGAPGSLLVNLVRSTQLP